MVTIVIRTELEFVDIWTQRQYADMVTIMIVIRTEEFVDIYGHKDNALIWFRLSFKQRTRR